MNDEQSFVCKKCGEVISPDARICPFCGKRLVKEKKEKKKKKKRHIKKLIVILIWVLLVLAVIAIGLFAAYKLLLRSYDCKELLDIHFDGSNKSGIAYVSRNKDLDLFTATVNGDDGTPLLTDVYDTENSEEAKELQDALLTYIYVADDPRDSTYKTTVDGIVHTGTTLSKMSGIKNGDIITVKVSYNRWELLKKGIRLENTEYTIKVTGLTSSATLDPFKNVEFKFSGVEGFGKVEVDLSNCSDAVIDNFSYNISPNVNLCEGDEVTVTASYKGESYDENTKTIEYGGKFYSIDKETTKTITVSELSNVSSLDPFEGMTIEYSGIDPYLKISGYNTSSSPKAVTEFFDYEASVSENLTAGQVITVKAVYKTVDGEQYTDSDLERAGYTLLKTERTYTVSDSVSKYADSADDFDMNKVAESFTAYLTDYRKGSNKVSLAACYFGVKKDKNSELSYNKYYEIYKIVADGKTIYTVCMAESIYKDESGKLHFSASSSNSTSPNLDTLVSEFVTTDEGSYSISKATAPDSPVNNFNITTTTTTAASTEATTAAQ